MKKGVYYTALSLLVAMAGLVIMGMVTLVGGWVR